MERLQRVIPLFSAAFSVLYVAAFGANFAPVVYYPLVNRIFREPQGPEAGPAMFYYGWFISALAGAAALSLLAMMIPQSWTRRIPSSTPWVVILLAIVWLCYLERRWFLG